jgi:hypothetical protein
MKPFQQYIFELNKPYEFRIKMAHIDPKSVMEQIKNALDSWELESVSAVKSHPIQEHREFPQWGACESWTFDIKLKYPTNQVQVAQVLKERANLEADWVCVRNLHEADFTDEAESVNANQKGALLDTDDLGGSTEGQGLVGQARIGSLLKELETRGFEVAGSDTTVGGEKDPAYGKTTNELPMGDKAPVGSTQNKVYRKPRG